ncbi:unnamed protein product [Citrullus colocynthis]|uniref:Agenet domain-containing protein n=1 Tax=Citrullus colocynthis TaxID=252529 RepID=A0ABP0XUQ9_9ROSI
MISPPRQSNSEHFRYSALILLFRVRIRIIGSMRLRKGDQVEVLSKKEVSTGSWSCAEIISGNGRSYSVRFFSSEEAMEKVPRRVIRPCPPPLEGSNVWDAGDLAEVFHNSSWKQAKIMKIVGVNCYMVRILGSPLDVMVRKSNLRRRQAWHDGRWFLLGKAMEDSGSLSRNRQIDQNTVRSKDQQLVVTLSTGPRKRPLPNQFINHKVSVQKRKVTEKDVRCLQSLAITTNMYSTQELNTIRLSSNVPTENTEVTTAHRSKKVEDTDNYSDAESSTGRGHEEEDPCSYEEELARSHSLWHTSFEEMLGSFSG